MFDIAFDRSVRQPNLGSFTSRKESPKMKKSFVLSLFLVMLVPGLARALECPEAVESTPADLVQFLEMQARTADPECVTRAIGRLGEFRSPLGTAVLVDLLDFRRPDSEVERLHAFDMHDRFPAVPALFGVGNPAVPALLLKLENVKTSPTARSNGIRAIAFIYRESPPEAVKIMKKAASTAKDQGDAVRLESSAKDAVAFCSEKWRAQCENEAK